LKISWKTAYNSFGIIVENGWFSPESATLGCAFVEKTVNKNSEDQRSHG
jgi:hypothetical protein